MGDTQARRLSRGVPQQLRLTAGLTTDDEHRAAAAAGAVERVVDATALAGATEEPHPLIRGHSATLEAPPRL